MRGSAAGWYVDVTDDTIERWWDGTDWTERTRSIKRLLDDGESNSGFFEVPNVSSEPELGLLVDGAAGGAAGSDIEGCPDPDEVDLEEILVGMPHPTPHRPPQEPDDAAPGIDVRSPHRGPRTWMNVAALVALVLVVGVATFAFVGANPNADASMALALSSTLNNQSADVSVTGAVGVGTAQVALSGTGAVDFAHNAAQLSLATTIHGHSVTENEIALGNTVYLDLGSLVNEVVPTKSWVSVGLGQLNQGGSASPLGIGGGLSTNNPSAILKVLGQHGNSVTALGQSSINGTTVQGYAVTVNQAAVRSELALAHLPAWMQQSVAVSGNLDISYKVFVATTGLLDRLVIDLSVPVDGQALTGTISMDFSNFGTPVSVTAPPPADVTSYQTFLQKY